MREILFRGKRTDNKQWVEGFYALIGELNPNAYIITDNGNMIRVAHKSISEFTGLTDKNGNKIFEGDIVGYYSNYRKKYDIGTVKYGDFNCSCCQGVYGWFFENGDIREHSAYEVLGNIYDNPELPKGE